MKGWLASGSVFLLYILPANTSACSVAGCLDRGLELRRSFSVEISYRGKPLSGASVKIIGNSEAPNNLFAESTDFHGIAHFTNLPTGDYWINADLLGIGAGFQCAHINSSASRRAKKKLHYEWGDMPVGYRQAAGRFVDSQPGIGSTPLEKLLHRVEVPIPEAKLELRQPGIGTVRKTSSDSDGRFVFDQVPDGIYVLHVDPGKAPGNRAYDEADLLVEFGDKARLNTIVISHRDAIGGSCGGTGLER